MERKLVTVEKITVMIAEKSGHLHTNNIALHVLFKNPIITDHLLEHVIARGVSLKWLDQITANFFLMVMDH